MEQAQLIDFVVETAMEKFGDQVFARRSLMEAVEARMRAEGRWLPNYDNPSGSRGIKSVGLAKIDWAFAPLKQSGQLVNVSRGKWCVSDQMLEIYEEYLEGGKLFVSHFQVERQPTLVQKKKSQVRQSGGRILCEICQFDFVEEYGELGMDFCECHHLIPLSSLEGEAKANSTADLAAVCANCHRMIHRHLRRNPNSNTIESLKVSLGKIN